MTCQPFRFHSIYVPRIWGGRRIGDLPGRQLPDTAEAIGEAWEISDRLGAVSIVKDGIWQGKSIHELWSEQRESVFGPGYEVYAQFPILCKLLDINNRLSVQVHPPLETAEKWHGEVKHEYWFILSSAPQARIYVGVTEECSPDMLARAVKEGNLSDYLNSRHLSVGEHVYIPAGLLHSVEGPGVIIEIQQNSDTTYRLYDWNRTDAEGKPRQLHYQEGLDAYGEFCRLAKDPDYLTRMPYFKVSKHKLTAGDSFVQPDRSHFAIYTVVEGSVSWDGKIACRGEFLLSPAQATPITATEDSVILMTTVPAN